ncbi:MAG: peptidylprolyl isomerase [Balneola sp.]
MRDHLILISGLLFLVVGALSCSEKVDDNVLAQINDYSITEVHFENAFKEYYFRTGRAISANPSTKLSVLNAKFDNYVLATFAEDQGLDQTEEAFQKRGEIERRVLNEEFLNQVILKDIQVTEQELNQYFVRFNTRLRASHLFAHDLESANELYQRLQTGESFAKLAKEVFQTPYLANNGGDIGRFTTDEMDIAFEEAAFKLKIGEISKPVPTAQGYSIIKLTDRFTKPILTKNEFANKKSEIAAYVYKKKKELATREHLYNFRDNLEFKPDIFDALWNKMNENYSLAISKDSEFISNLSSDEILASFKSFEFSMADFAVEYRFTPLSQINAIEGKQGFENFVIGTALRAYLFKNAKEAGIDDQEIVNESIQETFYTYLAQTAVQDLRSSVSNSDMELRNAYQTNRERFYKPLEVNLSRIVVNTEEKAKKMISELDRGADFNELVEKHTIINEDLLTNGELGFKSVKNYGSYSPDISELKVGEISEVINYQTGQYTIYKMNGRIEGRLLTFNEAKESVNAFLTNKKLSALKEKTIKDVKEKHNALIDIEKLNKVTIQI